MRRPGVAALPCCLWSSAAPSPAPQLSLACGLCACEELCSALLLQQHRPSIVAARAGCKLGVLLSCLSLCLCRPTCSLCITHAAPTPAKTCAVLATHPHQNMQLCCCIPHTKWFPALGPARLQCSHLTGSHQRGTGSLFRSDPDAWPTPGRALQEQHWGRPRAGAE